MAQAKVPCRHVGTMRSRIEDVCLRGTAALHGPLLVHVQEEGKSLLIMVHKGHLAAIKNRLPVKGMQFY